MPHIVMKRSDIPRATLQVLDLQPNVSQRNPTIDPPGQNKYVNAPYNDVVVTTGVGPVYMYTEARGLAAWFITNIDDGTGVQATGSFSIAAGNAAPGDTVIVNTVAVGGPNVTFTFVAGAPVLSTDVTVGGTEDISATNLANAINNALNGLDVYVTAAAPGGGPPSPVNLTAVQPGTAANSIAISAVGANLSASGATLAGGVNANALTAANANAIASGILTSLVRFGNLATPAVACNLAGVNGIVAGVVATAAITSTQLIEILDILSGRYYVAPEGVQVDSGSGFEVSPAVGTATGPRFVDPSTRHTYDTGSLKISFGEGHLSVFSASSFIYNDAAGAAVVVYADDGSLYTL